MSDASSRVLRPTFRRKFVLAVLTLLVAAASVRAADWKSSLEFVPADAHVYVSVSRLGEYVEKIGNSNWWKEVQKNENVRRAIEQIAPLGDAEPDADVRLSPAAQMLLDAKNLPLVRLAGEMAAEEVFFYTDRRAVDLLALFGEFSEGMYVGYTGIGFMFAAGRLDFLGGDIENMIAERLLRPVRDNLDKVKVPHLVVGFKIKDPAKAEKVLAAQVDRVRETISDFALSAPSDKILEETVAGKNCYIWRFNGESIPWPAVFDLHGDVPAAVEPILAHLRGLKGVVTLSVNNGYVLIGVADSPAWVEKLGQGELLADRPDFAPLKKLADKPITGVGYASREARSAWYFDQADVDNVVRAIKRTMEASEVSEPIAKDIGKALDGMAENLRAQIPRIGSSLTIAHTSPQGLEFTTYDNTEPLHVDGTKPLTILDHVGNAPVAFWAGRNKGLEELYGAISKLIAGSYALVDKHLFPAMQPDVQGQVRPFFDRMTKVVKRFDRAVRDLWLPPLAEGQSALVINARSFSGPWNLGAPPAAAEVPIPLPALVFGVKDNDQLHAGIKEFREIFNEGAQIVSETIPFAGPPVKIEEPKSREFPEGTIYWHVLPKDWNLDKRIAPNYGLGKGFAAFSFVPLDTQQLLGTSSLKLPAPLDKRDAPLAAAVYVDVPRVIETVGPWMFLTRLRHIDSVEVVDEDGSVRIEPRAVPVEEDGNSAKAEIDRLAALAKVVPSYTSATRVEGEATITHGILRIVDFPATSGDAEKKAEGTPDETR